VVKQLQSCAPGTVTEPQPPVEPSERETVKPLPGAVAFLGMGLSAAVCVAIGVGLGLWADSAWHTAPALLVVGLLLGLAAATFMVVGQIRRYL
jgi:F0F1-type ATP synthase assembly protein I